MTKPRTAMPPATRPKTKTAPTKFTKRSTYAHAVAWANKVRKSNKAFEKASPAHKRVIIAKDVLASIAAKRLTPMSGTYFEAPDDEDPGVELSASIVLEPGCQVCAKGALFCAKVDRLNGYTLDSLNRINNSDPSGELATIFDKAQLQLIEAAFELDYGYAFEGEGGAEHEESVSAERFGEMYWWQDDDYDFAKNNATVLVAIMENIVANKGTFCPDKLTPAQKRLANAARGSPNERTSRRRRARSGGR